METRRFQIYKCPVCDTVVEVLHQWSMELVCCGPAMVAIRAKTRKQEGWEDHAPSVQDIPGGCRVAVGHSPHPMTKSHRIEWIELVADGRSHRQFLSPSQPAEVVFAVKPATSTVRVYCTIHGLWQSTVPSSKTGPSPKPGQTRLVRS
jgi:superoxide reductase